MRSFHFFCNFCGAQFSTPDRWQRCCSFACGHRMVESWATPGEHSPFPRRQAELLRVLRESPSQWLTASEVTVAMYGLDDEASRRAFTTVLHRLRGSWSSHGLVIECRVERKRLDADGKTFYRLAHDIDETARAS